MGAGQAASIGAIDFRQSATSEPDLILANRISHHANPLDFGFEQIAGFHELRRRTRKAHAFWCATGNDVARFQRLAQ